VSEVDMETGEVIEPTDEPDEVEGEETPADEPAEEEAAELEDAGGGFIPFDQRSETEQNKVLDKLDREAERHTKRLTEILEEEALMLLPCELCNPRHAGWVNMSQVTEDARARVRVMIGDREPVKRLADRYARRCESCDGEGVTETGSKVSGQMELPCKECQGKGWVDPSGERSRGTVPAPVPTVVHNGPTETGMTGPTVPPMDEDVEQALALIRERGYSAFATRLP